MSNPERIPPPEPHHKPVERLIAARRRVIEAVESRGRISLEEASRIAEEEGTSLQTIIGQLPAECRVDWEGGAIVCR